MDQRRERLELHHCSLQTRHYLATSPTHSPPHSPSLYEDTAPGLSKTGKRSIATGSAPLSVKVHQMLQMSWSKAATSASPARPPAHRKSSSTKGNQPSSFSSSTPHVHHAAAFSPASRSQSTARASASASPSPSPSATTGTSTVTRRTSAGGLNPWASTTTDTLTTLTSASSLWEDAVEGLGYKDGGCRMVPESSVATTPSFSGLLRELGELERSVASWGARKGHHRDREGKLSPPAPPPLPPRHEQRRAKGELSRDAKENRFVVDADGDGDGDAGAGLEGSVAVAKQSDDPLRDFRRSMLQMIVENGIVAGEDLREMLRRFLTLNAPHHHDAILRAFAEIWDDVFVAAATATASSLDCASPAGRASSVPRREPAGRPPAPRTPARHRRSPPAWRV